MVRRPAAASTRSTPPQSRRLLRSLLTIVASLSVFAAIFTPGAALGAGSEIKLALTPIGEVGSFFDLTMRPGETRSLKVDLANAGGAALAARTYAADVYTIVNGGFGGRLRDGAQTDTTEWLDYPSDVLELAAGTITRRSFTVAVPPATAPGEYATSLVLENDVPIRGSGTVAVNQIVRQAVAVVITVPGLRSPALAIGEAHHEVVAGKSIVSVAVQNTGNVRLKPVVGFTLRDGTGAQVSQASVQMDTFYAQTDTFVEIPLASLLMAGTYTVSLMLDDATQGARADAAAIELVVDAPPSSTSAGSGSVPRLAEVTQTTRDGGIPLAVLTVILVAGLLLAVAACLIFWSRRRRATQSEVATR